MAMGTRKQREKQEDLWIAHTEFTVKKGGMVTITGRVVVSADGKTRTVTTSGTDPQGKKFESTTVYDKQ